MRTRPDAPARPASDERPAFGARLTAPLLLGSLLNPLNTTMISTALVAIGHYSASSRTASGRAACSSVAW